MLTGLRLQGSAHAIPLPMLTALGAYLYVKVQYFDMSKSQGP